MIRYQRIITLLFGIFIALAAMSLSFDNPQSAQAAGSRQIAAVTTDLGSVNNIGDYINDLLNNFVLKILAGLAALMLIYAGYIYLTSQGNPEALTRAKDIIIGVVTGIVLLFIIKLILVNTIGITTTVIK